MRIAALISITLHIAVFLIAWIGVLPSSRPLVAPSRVVEVEIATEIEKPKPKQVAKAKPKPAPPPPPPPRKAPPPPPPEPKVVAKADPAAIPEPKIKPQKKKPKPKPKAVEKPKPKPKKQVRKPAPRPKKSKPKPPPKHDFASVLKTVSKLDKKTPPAPKPKKAEPKKKDVAPLQQVAELLKKAKSKPLLRQPRNGVSTDELDAIRRQIEPCWNLPAGARDAESMVVEIRATLNPDGRVRSAQIVDRARAGSDRFYRSMAESALRAMLNPRCQPLPLPLDKYSEWRDMVIIFDPQEMF